MRGDAWRYCWGVAAAEVPARLILLWPDRRPPPHTSALLFFKSLLQPQVTPERLLGTEGGEVEVRAVS